MPTPDVPTPPVDPAGGNIFSSYDPQGAMGGLFAPAFIRGYAPSEQAVSDWAAAHHSTSPAIIDQTRMPELWRDPRPSGNTPYGGGQIPYNLDYTGQGMVDPAALHAASQGGVYDLQARRDAIAARLAENAALMSAAGFDPNDPSTQGKFIGNRRRY